MEQLIHGLYDGLASSFLPWTHLEGPSSMCDVVLPCMHHCLCYDPPARFAYSNWSDAWALVKQN